MLEIGRLRISRELIAHPLLGRAHVIMASEAGPDGIEHDGNAITAMSELDWERPTRIPAIAAPGKLPPGEGARLLNAIAERARDAGVTTLRYAGPYPTPALFRALARSFRTAGSEAEFTRDLVTRAALLATDEIPIDFAPAPAVRVDNAHGWCELRDGIERAVVAGSTFERDGSPGRLVDLTAEIWFGDARYARIARLGPSGELLDGPHAPPRCTSSVIGREFPAELRAAIGELVAEVVPAPLADAARSIVAERAIAWADLGARAARRTDAGFAVHAALWEHVAPLGLARLGLAIAEALAPVVTGDIVARL
ncbi:MAG TPA: hypothetical protein VGG74_29155 [Kofleriaceae bacterium]